MTCFLYTAQASAVVGQSPGGSNLAAAGHERG